MATKSYSKQKEYKEYSSSGTVPYTDEQFDMIKSDLLPKGSKLHSLGRNGTGAGAREYHYEYKEEKHPSGKYDRKDMRTVEEYTIPQKSVPKAAESSYYYEREERELPAVNTGTRTYNYESSINSTPGETQKYYEREERELPAVNTGTRTYNYESSINSTPGETQKYYEREERELPAVNTGTRTYNYESSINSTPGETQKYYEREERELPAVNTGTRTYNYESSINSTPGYSKVKSSKATKDLSQNVGELDSLLDDLQRDQERQLYKSGYTSDTAESTSFDYRKEMPKAPSSGYSTMKREERLESSSWGSSPPPPPAVTRAAEIRQEVYREEKTESRVVPSQVSPAVPLAVPSPLSRSSTPMNKVTTTVKTYTYEVPADQDPTTVPLPPLSDQERYVSTTENIRT
ncbi:Uncharacterized protein OBRU01_08712 [Operophtera brumata]|uniref:Uncharacterized protein n=1 Tax=Operophtera brumata TaxID=104452 RepID=A0A0L7LHK9_OPEBR|nr:Uncharacterized protein OBRU01_08712 [Operophtera brumata]